jgi:hypothetical protein
MADFSKPPMSDGGINFPWFNWFRRLYEYVTNIRGDLDSTIAKVSNYSSGTGTPEGVLTAPIGSLYTRTDGGASTTLYVKESGTGNTGWIAK